MVSLIISAIFYNFYFRSLRVGSDGSQTLFIPLVDTFPSIISIDFTDLNNPKLNTLGTYSIEWYTSYDQIFFHMSLIIDTGDFLYYISSINAMNYQRMKQITLLKVNYDFSYRDSWINSINEITINISNISYSFLEQPSLTFTCSVSTTQLILDSVSSQDYNFSDSPHNIWARPYLQSENWKSPQTNFVNNLAKFTFNVDDLSSSDMLNLCEQWQGVPINQTKINFISPDVDAGFLSFMSNGQLMIKLGEVGNVGNYSITIQNQLKLLNSSMTNFRSIDYIWDNPINFNIELSNNIPILKSNLVLFKVKVNTQLDLNILFEDEENDQVYFSLISQTSSIDYTYSSIQTQK